MSSFSKFKKALQDSQNAGCDSDDLDNLAAEYEHRAQQADARLKEKQAKERKKRKESE